MGSAVNGLGAFNPLTLIDSLTPSPASASSEATNEVSAQQEFSALQKSGDLSSVLSDSVAVGVLQFADPSSTPSTQGPDLSSLVSQLIAAYTPSESSSSTSPGGSTAQPSAASLSTGQTAS